MVFASSVREAGWVQAVILIRSAFVSQSIIHGIIRSADLSYSFDEYGSIFRIVIFKRENEWTGKCHDDYDNNVFICLWKNCEIL